MRACFSYISAASGSIGARAVVEMDHTAVEAAFLEQDDIQADAEWQPMCAASHDDGMQKLVVLVDQVVVQVVVPRQR